MQLDGLCCTLTNVAYMLTCATYCDMLPACLPTGMHRCWSPLTSSRETGAPHNCCHMLYRHCVQLAAHQLGSAAVAWHLCLVGIPGTCNMLC